MEEKMRVLKNIAEDYCGFKVLEENDKIIVDGRYGGGPAHYFIYSDINEAVIDWLETCISVKDGLDEEDYNGMLDYEIEFIENLMKEHQTVEPSYSTKLHILLSSIQRKVHKVEIDSSGISITGKDCVRSVYDNIDDAILLNLGLIKEENHRLYHLVEKMIIDKGISILENLTNYSRTINPDILEKLESFCNRCVDDDCYHYQNMTLIDKVYLKECLKIFSRKLSIQNIIDILDINQIKYTIQNDEAKVSLIDGKFMDIGIDDENDYVVYFNESTANHFRFDYDLIKYIKDVKPEYVECNAKSNMENMQIEEKSICEESVIENENVSDNDCLIEAFATIYTKAKNLSFNNEIRALENLQELVKQFNLEDEFSNYLAKIK